MLHNKGIYHCITDILQVLKVSQCQNKSLKTKGYCTIGHWWCFSDFPLFDFSNCCIGNVHINFSLHSIRHILKLDNSIYCKSSMLYGHLYCIRLIIFTSFSDRQKKLCRRISHLKAVVAWQYIPRCDWLSVYIMRIFNFISFFQ